MSDLDEASWHHAETGPSGSPQRIAAAHPPPSVDGSSGPKWQSGRRAPSAPETWPSDSAPTATVAEAWQTAAGGGVLGSSEPTVWRSSKREAEWTSEPEAATQVSDDPAHREPPTTHAGRTRSGRFQKGQSGNPRGRMEKTARSFSRLQLCKDILTEMEGLVRVKEKGKTIEVPYVIALIRELKKGALKGDSEPAISSVSSIWMHSKNMSA